MGDFAVTYALGTIGVLADRTVSVPITAPSIIGAIVIAVAVYSRQRLVELAKTLASRLWDLVINKVVARFDGELAYRILARSYCRSILADEAVSSVRVPPSRRMLPVGQIYVALNLRVQYQPGPHLPQATRIVGEPGSGKSTFLRYQLVRGCDLLLRPFGQRRSRLPVFLELAHSQAFDAPTDGECADKLLKELETCVDRRSTDSDKGVFQHFLKGRGVLVLLDGLDEVKQENLSTAARTIAIVMSRLRESGTNNRAMLTMREQAYRVTDDDLDHQFPSVGRFDPLSGNDIFEYLCKWPWSNETVLARGEATSAGVGTDRQSSLPLHSVSIASNVFALLENQPTLRGLCANPLILAMYIATVEDDSAPVSATTKTEFFKLVADELLYDRRARPRGSEEDRRLKLRSLREAIGQTAAEHLEAPEEPYNLIPSERCVDALRAFFQDPEQALLEIERDTGLIHFQGDDHITFIHGTFLDYFAARWYSNHQMEPWIRPARLERRLERRDLSSGRLTGVIAHGCSLAPRAGQDRALAYIEEYLPAFLGLAFVETRRYDHALLVPFLDGEVGMLRNVQADQFASVHDRFAHFIHILSDLDINYAFFPSVQVSPADYAKRCLEAAEIPGPELFRVIIEQDSSLALAFAHLVGAELSTQMPELYVESCDDWYVASALIDSLRSSDSSEYDSMSCVLLAEASLRYPSVSFLLDTIHAPRDTHYGWHFIRRHRRQAYEASGFYRSLLTVVLQRATTDPSNFTVSASGQEVDLTRLSSVAAAPRPNNWWLGHRASRVLEVAGFLTIPVVLVGALLIPGSTLTSGSDLTPRGVLVLGFASLISVALVVSGLMIQARIKLFRIVHRPHIDLDYLQPFGQRSWGARGTYWVTRVRYRRLVDLIVSLDREPFTSLLRRR